MVQGPVQVKSLSVQCPVQHKALLVQDYVQVKSLYVQCPERNHYLTIQQRYLMTTGLYVVGPSALPLFLLSTTRGRQTHQGKVTWGKDVLYS